MWCPLLPLEVAWTHQSTSLNCQVWFASLCLFFSFLTCFLLVFLSFCSDSSSSFLCVPFNSKSFLFWSPAAASVFSSASQRAAQTDAAFLSLFFISVFFLFLFKALTPQSAAAACQQTRLRPIPTAQRRPLNLKKEKRKWKRQIAARQTNPALPPLTFHM